MRVSPVATTPSPPSLRAIGVLAPADEIRIGFKTGGVIGAIHVEQGERIRRGQLLATLVDDEVAAVVSQARAVADKAERDFERGQALLADEVATREQVEDLSTARAVANASLRAAEFNARHSRIVAPGDGVVLRRLSQPRELVAPGQPVLVVGNTSGGWIVRATLSDRDIVRAEIGASARITLDAYPDRQFSGVVSELAAAADAATGTYEMKLAVDPQGERFIQGLVAKVEVSVGEAPEVAVVPITALLEANGTAAMVYVVAEGEAVARRVAVETGQLVGEQVEITSGLKPGQRVVIDGAAWLRDGAAVRIIDAR